MKKSATLICLVFRERINKRRVSQLKSLRLTAVPFVIRLWFFESVILIIGISLLVCVYEFFSFIDDYVAVYLTRMRRTTALLLLLFYCYFSFEWTLAKQKETPMHSKYWMLATYKGWPHLEKKSRSIVPSILNMNIFIQNVHGLLLRTPNMLRFLCILFSLETPQLFTI